MKTSMTRAQKWSFDFLLFCNFMIWVIGVAIRCVENHRIPTTTETVLVLGALLFFFLGHRFAEQGDDHYPGWS